MEQPACRVSGSEMLSALSDISALLRSSASVSETLSSLLAELCKIFDGEGALLWLVDDSHEVLKQRQHYHANGERSKAFETEASSTTVFFGDGIVGRVWAQGEPSILQLPAMFAQEPNPGEHSSAAKRDGSAVYCLTLPLLAGGTVYGAIEIVNCGVSSIDDSQRLFLHILSLQLGGFIAAHDALERASHQQEHVEHLIRRLKQMDNDLREAKSRLSGAHDDLIQASLSQGQFLAQISLDLRTPLSGIMSVAELIERTSLTSQQSELILIIKQSAESILHVLQQTIETTEEETRRFVQTQAELLVQESGSLPSEEARESLADARILVLHGLVGSAEFIEPFAIASGINCQAASRGYSGITAMRQAALAGRPLTWCLWNACCRTWMDWTLPEQCGKRGSWLQLSWCWCRPLAQADCQTPPAKRDSMRTSPNRLNKRRCLIQSRPSCVEQACERQWNPAKMPRCRQQLRASMSYL